MKLNVGTKKIQPRSIHTSHQQRHFLLLIQAATFILFKLIIKEHVNLVPISIFTGPFP